MKPIRLAVALAFSLIGSLLVLSVACGQHPASCQAMKPSGRGWSIGSAGLIAPDLVCTNHHVVGGSGRALVVWPNGVRIPGKVLGSDPGNDVAIIKLDKKRDNIRFFIVRNKFPKPGSIGFQDGAPHGKKWITRRVKILNYRMGYQPVTWSPYSISGDSGGPVYGANGAIYALCKATAYPRANESIGPSGYRVCQLLRRIFGRGCIRGGQFCPPGMICPPQGGLPRYPPPQIGQGPGGAMPGGGSPIPVEPMNGAPDPPDPDDYAGPTVPVAPQKPVSPPRIELDLDELAGKICEKMAGDERFRGPEGPEGTPGTPGEPGRRGPEGPPGQSAEIDYGKLIALIASNEAVLDALEDRLNEEYCVLVVDKSARWWPDLKPLADSVGIRIVQYSGGADVGPLPQIVRYVRGTPVGRTVGIQQVTAELGEL